MDATTKLERITESCLVRIGRTGQKTHRGDVEIEINPDAPSHRRRRIVRVRLNCQMGGGTGRLVSRCGLIPYPGTDPDKATCEWCG